MIMALYKYLTHLAKSEHAAFDEQNEPGTKTENAGIYRCVACGDEIGIARTAPVVRTERLQCHSRVPSFNLAGAG